MAGAVHNDLGAVNLEQGRLKDAAGHFARAVKLAPSYVQAYENPGSAFLALGQRDDARRALESALRLNPQSASARKLMGKLQ